MPYALSPASWTADPDGQPKQPYEVVSQNTNYIKNFTATLLDSTSRPATLAIDTQSLYSLVLFFRNTGSKALTACNIYASNALDSSGNVATTASTSIDTNSSTYWTISTALATLAASTASMAVWVYQGSLPRYIQVYATANDTNTTSLSVTVVGTYLT